MNRYKYILFDLDGTLTDSREGIMNCLYYAREKLGFELPDDLDRFLGPPLGDSFRMFCGMNEEQVSEAVRVFRERYSTVGLFENKVYDGIREMLTALRDAGMCLAVATCKLECYSVRITDKFNLAGYFGVVGGADAAVGRITKAQVIEDVLARAGVTDRSQVLMVGDRQNDVLGAHQTGIECAGALWGYGSAEELAEAGADYTAETPQALTDMLTRKD
ncbi:MAG: HAD hydrolase-like protein [Ruminococcus sp.]|nr:HAD hydrolase-like protein [Ruminococcus sp.]